MKCACCGREYSENIKFCKYDGHELTSEESVTADQIYKKNDSADNVLTGKGIFAVFFCNICDYRFAMF